MNKQIIEGNKLIAEFMGVKPDNKGWFDGYELHKAGLPFAYGAMGNGTNELKFHKEWSWLMLVWEKIVDLRDGFCIPHGKFLVKSIYQSLYIVDIEKTWKKIIEFI